MFKDFINKNPIERKRIYETRNLENGLRCNRNERVETWDKEFIEKLTSGISPIDHTIYPDLSPLYKAISKYEDIDQSKILIGSGIDGLIKNIFETYTTPNMNIGLISPTYAMYYIYANAFKTNIEYVTYDLETFRLNKEKLFKIISKVSLIFIPNPNQPIEDNINNEIIYSLAKECLINNTLLVIDEAYYGFGCSTAKSLINKFENLLVLRTFSKGFGMPAIRVGYMMGNEKTIKLISQKRLAYETTSLSAHIAIKLLDNISYINTYNDSIVKSRELIFQEILKLGFRANSENSNYILIDLVNESRKNSLNEKLIGKEIYVKNKIDLWGLDSIHNFNTENYILATIGPYPIMQPLMNILREFSNEN